MTATTKGKRSIDSLIIEVYVEIELEKIWPEKEIVIPNIYYDYDSATLREESFSVLDSLLTFFRENSDLKVEIGSHTDSRGIFEYNEKLSQGRAQSVVDYLVKSGISKTKLTAKGYGERKLINECADGVQCSEEKHQENRRTTFKVISENLKLESERPENIKVDPKK